jgi:hypothetical protein
MDLSTGLDEYNCVDEITITWSVYDVIQELPELNREQARAVLMRCKDAHDANVGIGWELIRIVAEELYPEIMGDEMLCDVAQRMQDAINDLYGGDDSYCIGSIVQRMFNKGE